MEYQLEIKQLVDYPRCRIYRPFIRTIMDDMDLRYNGHPGLYAYMVLCSYANFRTSYRRIDGICYTIYPGEWICRLSEITSWFRQRYQHQAIKILDLLQDRHYITYSQIGHAGGRSKLIKFKISDWERSNKIIEHNAPCCKDNGFFFFPVSLIADLVSTGKCSEIDIVLDLWLNTVYQDERVDGSDVGPVVYMRDGSGRPMLSYGALAQRWGISKATVCRILQHLKKKDLITLFTFPGQLGSTIYINNYLSVMFAVSDIMVDKDEVSFSLRVTVPAPESDTVPKDTTVSDDQIIVSGASPSVSKTYMQFLVGKMAQMLAAQGIPCCTCSKSSYILYPLSACMDDDFNLEVVIRCGESDVNYRFQLHLARLVGEEKKTWRNSL